jgi:hypothetical protein
MISNSAAPDLVLCTLSSASAQASLGVVLYDEETTLKLRKGAKPSSVHVCGVWVPRDEVRPLTRPTSPLPP